MKLKKALSLFLTGALTLSLYAPALAADLPEGWTPADGARVAAEPWYAEAQAYVMEKGLMTGTDKGFEPEATVTTATVLQTLYNMEGKPDVTKANDPWYIRALTWATEAGVYQADDKFEDSVIVRGEVKVIFDAYCGLNGCDSDGLMQGNENGDMMADKTLTRAEFAQILVRLDAKEPYFVQETVSIETEERIVPAIVTLPVGEGKFPAVVINHGHGGNKDEGGGFTGVARALAKAGIASIRMDFAGCGDSEAPFTENTLSNMAEDSNAARDYLVKNYSVDADKLGILGYSMGGRLALELVSRKQDNRYKAVALLSAAANSGEECIRGALGLDITVEQAKAICKEKGSYDYTTMYGQNLSLSAEWFDDMLVDPLAYIQNYTGPMLVLHGDQDVVVTDEVNKMIVAAYPDAREIIVPEADHGYGFYSDQPDVTAEVEGAICGFFQMNLTGKVGPARVASLDDWGDVYTDLPGAYFDGAGFDRGDILKVTVGEKVAEIPFCTTYSNVDNGKPLVITDSGNNVTLSYNMDSFTDQFEVKDDTLTYFEMAQKEGYLEEYTIRNINSLRTNDRADYASDESFANFRAVKMGKIAEGVLYRSSSPVNPELGRNTYSDALIKAAGVKTILDLADTEEAYEAYEGVKDSYAYTTNTVKVGISGDISSEENAAKLKGGLEYILANEGPYMVHCTEGKDRAGFVIMVMECLMGAKVDEMVDDHMLSYENYFHVEKDSDRWDRLAEGTVYADLLKLTGAESKEALAKVDLQKAAETYLTKTVGLTAEQVTALKDVLAGK